MQNLDKFVDLQTLKYPLGLFGLAIAVSAGLVFSSYWFKSSHANTRDGNFERLQSLQETENNTRKSGKIYNNFYGKYKKLDNSGFLGEERRLQWIETLRQASTDEALHDIEYNISEQRPYNGHLFVAQEQFTVQQSEMELKFGLSHEGKLLAFLRLLEQGDKGVFDIQQCTIKPAFTQTGIKPWDANITANCHLNWYTLKQIEIETEPDIEL